MVLEMKRALEDLRNGDRQGYRKIFDATYEEVYCRSILIIQREERAVDFIKDFYGEILGVTAEGDRADDREKWFWQRYYQKIRKQYHKLLEEQKKETAPSGVRTLAEIPGALPLLHRIMLMMYYRDDFSESEISEVFGLAEDKVQAEIGKLEKMFPSLIKGQPESVSGYLGSWRILLLGAFRQVLATGSDGWVAPAFTDAAAMAGISTEPLEKKTDNFEYFVADAEDVPAPAPAAKKKALPPVEDEEEDEEPYDEDEDSYEDEDEDAYDEDDEEEYDDEDDEDDDRYDWDIEDDGRRMLILGIVLALVIVAVVGFVAFRLLAKDDEDSKEPQQTEEQLEDDDDKLIVKGGDADGSEDAEQTEPQEEAPEQEPEEEEPQTTVMEVSGSSVNVRSETNTDSTVVTTVKAGEKVEILGDPTQEWVQIRCTQQNGIEGYVKSEFLKEASE